MSPFSLFSSYKDYEKPFPKAYNKWVFFVSLRSEELLTGCVLKALCKERKKKVQRNVFWLMINLLANLCPASLAFDYLHFCPVYTGNGHFQEGHVRLRY